MKGVLLILSILAAYAFVLLKAEPICQPGVFEQMLYGAASPFANQLSTLILEMLQYRYLGVIAVFACGIVLRLFGASLSGAILGASLYLLLANATACAGPKVFSFLFLPLAFYLMESKKAISLIVLIALFSVWTFVDFFSVLLLGFCLALTFLALIARNRSEVFKQLFFAVGAFIILLLSPVGRELLQIVSELYSNPELSLFGQYRFNSTNFHAYPHAALAIALVVYLKALGGKFFDKIAIIGSILLALSFEGSELLLAFFLAKEVSLNSSDWLKPIAIPSGIITLLVIASFVYWDLDKENQLDVGLIVSEVSDQIDSSREVFSHLYYSGHLAKLSKKPFVENSTYHSFDASSSSSRLADYRKILDLRSGWQELLDTRKISQVLLPVDSSLLEVLRASGKWTEVFRTKTGSLSRMQSLGRESDFQAVLLKRVEGL